MSHKKQRLLISASLALLYLIGFAIHLTVASLVPSDAVVRIVGYTIDLTLTVMLALAAVCLYRDCRRSEKAERYLLPALPFLARIFYFTPYYTVDFTINENILSAVAIPFALLQSVLESLLLFGAYALIYYLHARVSKEEMTDETGALIAAALPLVRTLIGVLVSLLVSVPSGGLWGGVVLDYLLELALALAAATLSYFAARHLQGKI